MSNTGAIYKNGIPYSEYDASDIKVAASAMRAVCDAKGNKIKDTYVKKSKQTTEFFDTATYHNSVYRGKDLSARFKSGDLYAEIASGKFRDMFIGDYFNVSFKNPKKETETVTLMCRIAKFIEAKGSEPAKVIIVPLENIFGSVFAKWNMTDTLEGGYQASNIKTEIESMVPTLTTIFGEHLKNMTVFNTNVVGEGVSGSGSSVDGKSSEHIITSVKIDLMNEQEIFGTRIWGSTMLDNETLYGHLPLFRLNPWLIPLQVGGSYWTKSIRDGATVVIVLGRGTCSNTNPSATPAHTRVKFAIG